MAEAAARRPRILGLHGFRTSKDILEAQISMAAQKKFFAGLADIVYVNAPHDASGPAFEDVQQFFDAPFYEWWDTNKKEVTSTFCCGFKRASKYAYDDVEASLRFLELYMQQHGPFDGLLGFSQGATMATTITALQHEGTMFQAIPKIKFCILVAGPMSDNPRYTRIFSDAVPQEQRIRVPCPTCIIIGDQDPHKVPCDGLIKCFEKPTVLRHGQGHLVPRLTPEQQEEVSKVIKGSS